MTDVRTNPVNVCDNIGKVLKEGETYDLIESSVQLLPNCSSPATFLWLKSRGDGKIYPVVTTGEVPAGTSYIITKGVARRTNPPE